MPFNCPHCQKPVDNVVETATMTERLKAKQGEIDALKDEVKNLGPKAQNYDAVAGERDALKTEIATVREQATRTTALAGVGVTDPRIASSFAAIYASEMSGREEKDRVPFVEFDKWAQDHPLLSGHIKAPSAGAPPATATTAQGAQPPAPQPSTLPRTGGAAQPPQAPQGKMTSAQIQAYFRSPEYRAMKPEDQRQKMRELQAQVATPPKTT